MLDGILGAASGMVPGGQMLGVVAMGIELAKGLFEKGDMQGTQDMLKFLNEVVSKLSPQGGQASEPQPFTSPQFNGPQNSEMASFNPPVRQTIDITIDVNQGGSPSQPINYGHLPLVNNSAADDMHLTRSALPRVDGSGVNINRAFTPGSNEWTTVMWAMQQNPNVRYNADTQEFTMKMTDGSSRSVCSLSEAQQAAGSFDRSNPSGATSLGNFLNQRVGEAQSQPSGTGDLQKLVDELKKLLKQFEEAQQMMQKSTIDVTVSQAVA